MQGGYAILNTYTILCRLKPGGGNEYQVFEVASSAGYPRLLTVLYRSNKESIVQISLDISVLHFVTLVYFLLQLLYGT